MGMRTFRVRKSSSVPRSDAPQKTAKHNRVKEAVVKGSAGLLLGTVGLTGSVVANQYHPGEVLRPSSINLAHGYGPQGQAIARAVVDSPGGTVDPEYAVTAGRVSPTFEVGNQAVMEAQAKLIENAQFEVLFQTFGWNDSDNTQTLLDAFKQLEANRRTAADGKPPVQVYIALDDRRGTLDRFRTLFATGKFPLSVPMRAREMVAAEVDALHLDPALVQVHVVSHRHFMFGAQHGKGTLVDRRVFYSTGTNPEFPNGYGQYDLGFTLTGKIVHSAWKDFTFVIHNADSQFTFDDRNWPVEDESQPQVPMIFATRRAQGTPFPNEDNPQTNATVELLTKSQHYSKIITPNLNAKPVVDAILAGARAGKVEQIILSKDFNQAPESAIGQGGPNDAVVQKMYAVATNGHFAQFLQVKWFAHDGRTPEGMGKSSHTKEEFGDGVVMALETKNEDTQSEHSHEIETFVDDRATVAHFESAIFDVQWDKAAPASGSHPENWVEITDP